jgi:hypothetical protein
MAAWTSSVAANDPTAFLQALEVSMDARVKKAVDSAAQQYVSRAQQQQGFQAGFFRDNPGLVTGEAREMFDGALYRLAAQNRGLNQTQLYAEAQKATLALMERMGLEQVTGDAGAAAAAVEAAKLQGVGPRGTRPPESPAPPDQNALLATFTQDVGKLSEKRRALVTDPRLPQQ